MARNFLDQEDREPGLSFGDGFRFGFGFFIASLLGLVVVGAIGLLVNYLLPRFQ